jgi:hypothetical protein
VPGVPQQSRYAKKEIELGCLTGFAATASCLSAMEVIDVAARERISILPLL